MAKQIIDVGSAPSAGDGDSLRTSFAKVNANFDELYSGQAAVLGSYAKTVAGRDGDVVLTTSDLDDVVITTPGAGQVLSYNGTSWVNSTPAAAGEEYLTVNSTGGTAAATGQDAIALGFNTNAAHTQSAAIGALAATTKANQVVLGTATEEVTVPGKLVVATATPASATATGTAGTIAWDADYIYVCTATDTWVRAPIATWT